MGRVVTLFTPKEYQKPIIESLFNAQIKYTICCMSRRIGKSLTAKNVVLYWLLNRKCSVGYITPTSDLSRKFIKEMVTILEDSGLVKSSNTVDKFITFFNGSIIYFMSAEGRDNNRGSGFDYLVFDEAAFISTDTYLKVFKPMELQAKKVLMISTPNGSSGFFYEAFDKGQNSGYRYRSFKTTLDECGLYDDETVEEIKQGTTRAIYAQEYNCEFVSDDVSAFGNFTAMVAEEYFTPTERLFAGIDFSGDGANNTVLTIVNERCEMVSQHVFAKGDSKSIDDMARILNAHNVAHCFAETNSMGAISIDYLRKQFRRVEGIATTNTSKRAYVENTILNFEQGIGGIVDKNSTVLEFSNFTMKRTSGGNITYGGLSETINDDTVISYCLACWSVRIKGKRGKYTLS